MENESFYGKDGLAKLSVVFYAFKNYIDSSDKFELYFSEKKGFIFAVDITEYRLVPPAGLENTTIIQDADDLFDYLVLSIIDDVDYLNPSGPDDHLTDDEIAEIRRRMEPYLNTFLNDAYTHYSMRFEEILSSRI